MNHRASGASRKPAATRAKSPKDPLAPFAPWIERHRRAAWRPILSAAPGKPNGSRFGGAPFLRQGEKWPACPGCDRPFSLFLQLNNQTLPADAPPFGNGILQLFYCSECEDELAGANPFSDAHLLRVAPHGPGGCGRITRRNVIVAPQSITGWSRIDDLPDGMELVSLGIVRKSAGKSGTTTLSCPSLGIGEVRFPAGWRDAEGNEIVEALGRCAGGDKLAGWPNWPQWPARPACPKCSAAMRNVFQLASGQGLDFMFGDAGVGHIWQCPQHSRQFAFHWDCQ